MKIVYIYHSFILKGGIERVFCDKMNYLAQNTSYDVTFITFEQGNHPFAYKLNDRIKNPKKTFKIAIAGKYTDLSDAYISVVESLKHAGYTHNAKIDIKWIASDECVNDEETKKKERKKRLPKDKKGFFAFLLRRKVGE